MKPQGIEVHYLNKHFTKFADHVYLRYNDAGTERWEVAPEEVERHVVTEWFQSDCSEFESDIDLLEHVWMLFQNGIPGIGQMSSELMVRSMMVGDRIVLQTNNHGPKRVYEVAGLGWDRIK